MAAAAPAPADDPVSVLGQNKYSCAICLEDLMISPVETNCKHLFCLYCIINWFERQRNDDCPCCRTKLREIKRKDNVEEEIENILLPALSKEERVAWKAVRENRSDEKWFKDYFEGKKEELFADQLTMQLVRANPVEPAVVPAGYPNVQYFLPVVQITRSTGEVVEVTQPHYWAAFTYPE